MDKMLHLLETFTARGSDGKDYAVRGYEHLARLEDGAPDSWEPTGQAEYKLADGRHVHVEADGTMRVPELGLRLERRRGEVPLTTADAAGDALVACEVCLREVPRSEAVVPEATDYVAHFCDLRCFEQWKKLPERASPPH